MKATKLLDKGLDVFFAPMHFWNKIKSIPARWVTVLPAYAVWFAWIFITGIPFLLFMLVCLLATLVNKD